MNYLLLYSKLLATVYAGYDALTIWKRNKLLITQRLNHRSRHALRSGHAVAVAWCTFGPTWLGLVHALLLFSVYFLVFDPVLNSFRGLRWDYVSDSNAWDQAWMRRFGTRAGRVLFAVELACLLLLLTLFILITV